MIPIPLVCRLVAIAVTSASAGSLPAPVEPLTPSVEDVREAAPGTIVGKVVFEGITPPKRRIIPSADQEVCGGMREVDRIVLAPDRGIQGAVVYLKRVERGKPWPKPAAPARIEKSNCGFLPRVQVVPVGEVDFVNSDPIAHTVHLFQNQTLVSHVDLMHHHRITKSLDEPGLYRLECDAHGWERGWLYVVENPYYDLSRDDGSFRITDVPPGRYTLIVWHEYTGEESIPVAVTANGGASVHVTLKR